MPVAGRLVEQADEVRIFQNIFNLRRQQQILDVLRGTCGNAAPFPETLPNLAGKGRCLFLPQQQMKFITKEPGGLALAAILRHPAPNLVLDDQHPDFL